MSALFTYQNAPARIGARNRMALVQAHAALRPWASGYGEAGHLVDEMGRFTDYLPLTWMEYGSPCMVRPDLTILGKREEEAYPPTPVGPWGAGPNTMAAAIPHAVKVYDPLSTVAPIWYDNAHLVPSTGRRAITKKAKEARDKRRSLHILETQKIIDNASGLARVVIGADWNQRSTGVAAQMLKAAGFKIVADSGIDWWAVKGVRVVASGLMPNNGSDHPGIWIEVR
jgi:hypothetical protein